MTENTTHTNGTDPHADHDHPSIDEVANGLKEGLTEVLARMFPDSGITVEDIKAAVPSDPSIPHLLPCGCVGVKVERSTSTPSGSVGIDVVMHFDADADRRSVQAELGLAYMEAATKIQHLMFMEQDPDRDADDHPFEAPPEGVDVTEGADNDGAPAGGADRADDR